MDTYAGRLLADRYRLPRPPSEEYELVETRAFDTASGQEVRVRQVPLPEVVDAELLDGDRPGGPHGSRGPGSAATRTPDDPVVRRAVEAAAAAASIPDHPRLDQVFDVFVQGDGLWIVSELVSARPLASLLTEQRLNPYRAAEVAADLLAALRVVHAHGWTHRNLTSRTVLVCDDGRALLTGLAAGAAEEVLCGYDPFPADSARPSDGLPPGGDGGPAAGEADPQDRAGHQDYHVHREPAGPRGHHQPAGHHEPGGHQSRALDASPGPAEAVGPGGQHEREALPPAERHRPTEHPAAEEYRLPGPPHGDAPSGERPSGGAAELVARVRQQGGLPDRETPEEPRSGGFPAAWDFEGDRGAGHRPSPAAIERAARSGAIAAYRAGTRAGADAAGNSTSGSTAAARHLRPADQSGPPASPAPQDRARPLPGPAGRGSGPTELPGARRPSSPVRTGWENIPVPARNAAPEAAPTPAGRRPPSASPRYRGPDTALAAERARQARMTTVGAVTERWAPEQAGPVHNHWQLAPPVGPAADLWALGALLFRAVQGHPPYPEDSTAELVQAVCGEQPAFAEECGALRPVVESLLRRDPTERPDPEELRGWLRSIIRTAPEPEVGRRTVTAPAMLEAGRPADPHRLPVVRRRGEMVSKRRNRRRDRDPRWLGRTLLILLLLGVGAAMAYALLFLPESGSEGSGEPGGQPAGEGPVPDPTATEGVSGTADPEPTETSEETLPEGFTPVDDPAGFRLALPDGWERQGEPADGQVRYTAGELELLVVPGRDSAEEFGDDPMQYQLGELAELRPYYEDTYSSAGNLRRTEVGQASIAEGVFTWRDGGEQVAYNRATLMGGHYHVVLMRGPESSRDALDEVFEVVAESYRVTAG
ncbi:serine/threonine protein kinase [Streptomyces sp. ACA25]|uniref:protein kinase n=1 Tax=Streptomyces sp. ACA25 TaxID=3022596 RepID=UPI0023073A19|nr:protein kinase [Streptomyces sp. ACA25]MDB1087400.1 serine/threonine protein kinase [Streptomyces sp. ACA25]